MTETNNQSAQGLDNRRRIIDWVSLINKAVINDQNK